MNTENKSRPDRIGAYQKLFDDLERQKRARKKEQRRMQAESPAQNPGEIQQPLSELTESE